MQFLQNLAAAVWGFIQRVVALILPFGRTFRIGPGLRAALGVAIIAAILAVSWWAGRAFDVQRGLPENYLKRYFKPAGNMWQISDHIRGYITFKKFNLLDDYSSLGAFDVVFCRNVLIYFDVARKKDIVRRIGKILAPDGCLFLGSAESLLGLGSSFVADKKNAYFVIEKK